MATILCLSFFIVICKETSKGVWGFKFLCICPLWDFIFYFYICLCEFSIITFCHDHFLAHVLHGKLVYLQRISVEVISGSNQDLKSWVLDLRVAHSLFYKLVPVITNSEWDEFLSLSIPIHSFVVFFQSLWAWTSKWKWFFLFPSPFLF